MRTDEAAGPERSTAASSGLESMNPMEPKSALAVVEESRPAAARRVWWAWLQRIGRVVLLVGGVAAVVLLIRDAGPRNVAERLLEAAPWLPLILLLEVGFISADVFALRALLGERAANVPSPVWLRSAMVAYGVMMLLPAGRAGGEVARAAALSPYVGGARAAALAASVQATTLLGNTTISVPCFIAVVVVAGMSPLAYAVLVNGLVTGLLGGVIIVATRRSSFGEWLGKRIPFLASHGPSFDAALRQAMPWDKAVVATTLGRVVQALQYGIILHAVGGSLDVLSALVSQGIHLVGAGMGDMVPNQAGITEGAYRLFAPSLGLQDNPAKAISIALLARLCQFSLASVCLATAAIWKGPDSASASADTA